MKVRIGVVFLAVVGLARPTLAEKLLQEISWADVAARGQLISGTVLPADVDSSFARLQITGTAGKPTTVKLLVIDDPKITSSVYSISGQVRYEGVQGQGYLELLNHFSAEQMYFSRTLSSVGPTKYVTGSSAWRRFVLVFNMNDGSERRPQKLELNVVLPGAGTVYLGPIRLTELQPGENPFAQSGQWWTGRQAGWIGGVGGSILGCLGGLMGYLVSRGRARAFVLVLQNGFLVVGVASLVAGIVAVAKGQPYAVYYPLLLVGGIVTFQTVFVSRTSIRRRYAEIELRKIAATDAAE